MPWKARYQKVDAAHIAVNMATTTIMGRRINSGQVYLEENTPGQTIDVTILRENKAIVIAVTLGTRP